MWALGGTRAFRPPTEHQLVLGQPCIFLCFSNKWPWDQSLYTWKKNTQKNTFLCHGLSCLSLGCPTQWLTQDSHFKSRYYWVTIPFGGKISGTIFQEELDSWDPRGGVGGAVGRQWGESGWYGTGHSWTPTVLPTVVQPACASSLQKTSEHSIHGKYCSKSWRAPRFENWLPA